jgi:Sporulation and spore germination
MRERLATRRVSPTLVVAAGLLPVVFGLGLVACGIPTGNDSFSVIPNEDVPFGLDETSTTTSTTTTTTPLVPATTVIETTTTIARFESVDIYFLSRGRLQPVPLALTSGFAPDQLVDLLEKGPPPAVGLDTLIEPGLITSTNISRGVVTVDLDPEVFERIATFDQAEAIGQIVLSLTRNLRGVGSVLFTLGGESTQVKKGDSVLSEPGQAVTLDDYAALLASTSPTTTTTTTTTEVPAATVPVEPPPATGP